MHDGNWTNYACEQDIMMHKQMKEEEIKRKRFMGQEFMFCEQKTHERWEAKGAELLLETARASVPSERAWEEGATEERRESYPTRHSDSSWLID